MWISVLNNPFPDLFYLLVLIFETFLFCLVYLKFKMKKEMSAKKLQIVYLRYFFFVHLFLLVILSVTCSATTMFGIQ